jgi:predicted RNA-binding Zn-ribbon protein involved in translation (DUF1610 family)
MAKDEPEDVVAEIRTKLKAIDEALKTCHGEDCDRLDKLKAQLEKVEAGIPDKVKAAMDSRTALFDERLKGIEAAVATVHAPPVAQNPPTAAPAPATVAEVEIPEDRVFVCPKCGDALIIGQPECPNETCEQVIDWTEILNVDYLREVEKGLQGGT